MAKQLVITEKPSVARDIAAALGGFIAEDEFLESEDYVLTWALGHLLELSEPQDYDKKLRSWSIKLLPVIPEAFTIKPRDGQKRRLDRIKKLGKRKDVEGLINACDAGREGELIYRRIVEFTGLDAKPQQRLWLQSMTESAIRDAFTQLRPGTELDRLSDAAWLRSVGDWLIGMNATRALTQRLKSRGERGSWSAGRVQTPTLNLLVQREREILAHVPRPYWEIEAEFSHGEGDRAQTWIGKWWDPSQKATETQKDLRSNRIFDREQVVRLMATLTDQKVGVAGEKRRKSKQKPPLPFDLTLLQREANKRYTLSAKRTLEAAQRLYEGHKLLTYPRTDCRHLPDDYGPKVHELLDLLSAIPPEAPQADLAGVAGRVLEAGPQNLDKVLDSSKVTDHFAIIPTGTLPTTPLSGDDARVYDLVVRQFVAALMGPATWATVERVVEVEAGEEAPARFRTTARSLEEPGFLEAMGQEAGTGKQLPALVPGEQRAEGVGVAVEQVTEAEKETRPPARYSEAQLLRMMETAGEQVDDEGLSDAMSGRGLGTPATRADTIERLVRTTYARRVDGRLGPTSKAMRLLDVLERLDAGMLASPKLTGEWEFALREVESGKKRREEVHGALVAYTKDVVGTLVGFEHEHLYDGVESLGPCPACGGAVGESAWGYPCENNSSADSECNFIIWKDRAGRYVDRGLAAKLIAERRVPRVEGLLDPSGRRYLTGAITLQLDPDKGRWVLDTEFGPDAGGDEEPEVAGDPLWPCPDHPDCSVVETNRRFVCKKVLDGETRAGPVLPKHVCRREMSVEEASAFFSEVGKTETLEGFISRRGRPFRGALFRKPTGKHGFEFPPREPRAGAKKKTTAKKTTAKKTTAAAKKKTTAAARKRTTTAAAKKKTTAAAKKKTTAAAKKRTTAAKKKTTAKTPKAPPRSSASNASVSAPEGE